MSLIFGINLSNRIYLAADTRLSYFSTQNLSSDLPTSTRDDLLKIEYLNQDIIVAAAGSLKLARFLISELKKEQFINEGIFSLKKRIKNWVASKVDTYLASGNAYGSVCLLFGGIDRSKKKKISSKKLMSLVQDFQKIRPNISIGMNHDLFLGISSKPHQPNPFPELPVSDSTVFAVLSDAKRGILKVETTEWGEYLAYGPKGFNKKNLPVDTFGRFEFKQGSGIKGTDPSMLTAMIISAAENNGFATVGGSIIPIMISDQGIFVVTSKVNRMSLETHQVEIISDTKLKGGKIYYFSTETNKYEPLVSMLKWSEKEGFSFL